MQAGKGKFKQILKRSIHTKDILINKSDSIRRTIHNNNKDKATTCSINESPISSVLDWYIGTVIK